MLIPAAFAEQDLGWLDRLVARDSLVTLLTTGSDGLPCCSLLPVLYRRQGQQVLIEGHWARSNPQAAHAGRARLLLRGPHGYVSPGWYTDKHSASRVPTWNHASAELTGSLETHDDPAALADLLERLSAQHETAIGSDWTLDRDDPRQMRMLGAITGFRFRPDDIRIQLKFSQNHPQANQLAVIQALSDCADASARELAAWMRQRIDPAHATP
jgi:transcriptional regulator